MSAHSGPSGAVNQCPPPDTTFVWIYFPPDTYALCAAVSGATIKTVSCRTPANHSPSGVRPAGPCHPRPLRSPSCWPLSPTAPPESAQRGPCHHRPDWNLSCLTRHCLRISPGHAARTETGWRCPSGHRFTHSPWHRSAKRAGVTGLPFPLHMVSGRGHRFTAPDGVSKKDKKTRLRRLDLFHINVSILW